MSSKIDLSSLSEKELAELLTSVPNELNRRKQAKKREVLHRVRELAKENGFTLEDLTASATPSAPVAAKYRHPEDPSKTWTGRGRQPVWVREHLEAGNSLESLAI